MSSKWSSRGMFLSVPVLALFVAGAAWAGDSSWNFDEGTPGNLPAGFSFGRTGSGRPGRWEIVADKTAPSGGKALGQLDADDTDYRFPVAVVGEPGLVDVDLSVSC